MHMTRRQRVLWLLWFGVLVAVGATMLVLRARLDRAHVALIFLLVVLGGSSAAGRALGIALAFGAFLAFNYFFLPPYLTFAIADPLDWLVLVTFLITSLVAAQLLYRARSTAEAAMARAAEVDRLATLGAETLNLARPEDALRAILDVIRTTLGVVSCDVLIHGAGEGFVTIAHSPADVSAQHNELSADWSRPVTRRCTMVCSVGPTRRTRRVRKGSSVGSLCMAEAPSNWLMARFASSMIHHSKPRDRSAATRCARCGSPSPYATRPSVFSAFARRVI
jgi:K+-sensing histidine kinase KdpD